MPFRPLPPTTADHSYRPWLLTATRSKCQFRGHAEAWEQLHQPCHPAVLYLCPSLCQTRCLSPSSEPAFTRFLSLGFLVPNSSSTNTTHPSAPPSNADPCEAMPHPSPPDGRPAPSCLPFSPHKLLTRSFCLCFACESCVPSSFLPGLTRAESPSSVCWLRKREECPFQVLRDRCDLKQADRRGHGSGMACATGTAGSPAAALLKPHGCAQSRSGCCSNSSWAEARPGFLRSALGGQSWRHGCCQWLW